MFSNFSEKLLLAFLEPEALRKDLLAIGQGEHIIIQLEKLNALHSREPLAVHRDRAVIFIDEFQQISQHFLGNNLSR
jgi:hypothetical protein